MTFQAFPLIAAGRSRPGVRAVALLCAAGAAALVLLAGCGPVQLVASARIPQPLVVKIPVAVALFMPQQFSQYIHKEERWGTDWNIDIGKAQTDAMSQLMTAMFDKVIVVDSLSGSGTQGSDIAAILEPSVEEYAFVTPRDAGSPFFAVSIKYRVNVYLPDGKLADSWGFTGYGTAPAGGLSNTEPLENATALAMRDAGAKLAVEFREQPVVRGLFPDAQSADDPVPLQNAPRQDTPTQIAPAPNAPAPNTPAQDAPAQDAPAQMENQPEGPGDGNAAGEIGAPESPEASQQQTPSTPVPEKAPPPETQKEEVEQSVPEVEAFALSRAT